MSPSELHAALEKEQASSARLAQHALLLTLEIRSLRKALEDLSRAANRTVLTVSRQHNAHASELERATGAAIAILAAPSAVAVPR